MSLWICLTCGAEHPDTRRPPDVCAICADDRQWIPPEGQRWSTASDLEVGRTFTVEEIEPDLFAVTVTPEVAIGQRSLVLRTPHGNILWEPSAYISADLVVAVEALGRVVAVAASHPHLAGAAVSWSHMLSARQQHEVPILWNAHDRRWVQRPDPAYVFWTDRHEPVPGVTLLRAGGHFPGSCVLHWPAGAGGRGVLLVGDTLMVGPSGHTVSFMRSYPNQLPLSERLVRQIVATLEPLAYDRIHGAFPGRAIVSDAPAVVRSSAERYIGWLTDTIRDPDEELPANTQHAG
ncbi:hydrolase [Nakamurella deserti]|uniref:hydrolase n=1 Tax=Nakamurella deserti TaxID=2164074 RepID=UPI000DBE538E|nr:hydrolase [Nakamurella deserti]